MIAADAGAELLVSLTPPGRAEGEADVVLAGHVARASLGRRRVEIGRSGMGVSFDAIGLERAQRFRAGSIDERP